MMGCRGIFGTFLIALAVAQVRGVEPANGPEMKFGFGEPQVIKLDWSTRALQVHDLNGNGLQDLAVINNDSAQIELLYQLPKDEPPALVQQRLQRNRWDPILSDGNFRSEKITIGVPLFDLGVGDLNNDGLPDLVYSSRSTPLTVRYQGENGHWLETLEFDGFDALGWRGTLKVADLNGDGLAQVVLLAADAVRVFSQDASGRLQEPEVYFVTGENPFNLELVDVSGNGLMDICYVSTEGQQAFVMREQLDDGGFGAERRFVLDRSLRMYTPLRPEAGRPLQFSSVDSRSGSLEFFEIQRAEEPEHTRPLDGVQPLIYPVFRKVNEGARYSFADLSGNGEPDLQVVNPASAELMVYLKKNGRYQAMKRFPSFSAISSLAGGRFFDSAEEGVVALSREEKTLGISYYDSQGRLSFPRLIEIGESGDPLVCHAVDLDGDGFDELALILESKGQRQLVVVRPEDRSDRASKWELVMKMDLESPRRRPEAIRVVDVFGQRGPGLMLFVPREAPVFLAPVVGGDSYELELVGERSSIRESLLKDITPAQISEFDVNGDGYKELVAARSGFVRALRFADDTLEMVDQFNARRSGDLVSGVIPHIENGLLKSLVLYVEKEGELQFLLRDEDGVLRYRRSEKVGPISLSGWKQFSGQGPEESTYLLYGEDRFWYFAPSSSSWKREIGDSYETQLEDVFFSQVHWADFDADGQLELIAVDGTENVLEILSRSADGWTRLMYWEIFEQNMHYRGRTGAKLEPREVVRADLNGDGKLDFAFLIHDRILIYPQE
ncbi:MAG: VCBS repeat-containing protein [Puniceicoccaceae bacterium]|nr:MAG: VCBS repeat-containing protein [Puniceicoccaceae bacterium]